MLWPIPLIFAVWYRMPCMANAGFDLWVMKLSLVSGSVTALESSVQPTFWHLLISERIVGCVRPARFPGRASWKNNAKWIAPLPYTIAASFQVLIWGWYCMSVTQSLSREYSFI